MRDILLFIIAILLFAIVLILLPFWLTKIILYVLAGLIVLSVVIHFWDFISEALGVIFFLYCIFAFIRWLF